MSDVTLGVLPIGPLERDAIHVAVVPMIASEMLLPAQRIGVVGDGIAGPSGKITGIVDPYLTDVVPKGSAFWMCLLPGTVTGMRHHWSHPEFSGPVAPSMPEDPMAESIAWLKEAAKSLGVDYETLVSEYGPLETDDYINNGEHICDIWYGLADEFWKHHKVVTGRDVPELKRGGFTCSC